MKKVFRLLVIVCIILTGCTNNNSKLDEKEYKSIKEINEVVGTNIVSVEKDDLANEKYAVISNNIAQYTFEINKEKWTIRASKDIDNDISGIQNDNITFEKEKTSTYYNDNFYLFRFFYEDVQYVVFLDVKGNEISTSYFDGICNEFKSNVTGVKSGYDTELLIEEDKVINRVTFYNDGTKVIMEVVYSFENDKMVSIVNNNIFDTEELAREYYDSLIEGGTSPDSLVLEGKTITSNMNSNLEFYSDLTKDEFIKLMQESAN